MSNLALTMKRGDSFRRKITIEDADATQAQMEALTLRIQIRDADGDLMGTPTFTDISAADGVRVVMASVPASETDDWRTDVFQFDVEVTDPSNDAVASSPTYSLTIEEDVTLGT